MILCAKVGHSGVIYPLFLCFFVLNRTISHFFSYLCGMKRLINLLLIAFSLAIHAEEKLQAYKLTSENGLPDNNIRYIVQDSTGFLRMISLYAAYQYDGYRFRRLPHETFLQLTEERRVKMSGSKGYIEDNLGNKILTEKGNSIIYIDKNTGERIQMEVFNDNLRQLSPSLKCMVVTDRDSLIWVSVNGNGLFVYDRRARHLRHISKNDGTGLIDANFVVYIMEDQEGNIWVSQEHCGLVCLKKGSGDYSFMNIGDNNRMEKENEVRNLTRLADGSLLLSNRRGKLMKADGNLEHLTTLQDQGEIYNCAALDTLGRLWLGSLRNGVNIEGKWYGKGRVDCIVQDRRGRMWMCGLHGTVVLAGLDGNGNYTERSFMTGIDKLGARKLLLDHEGNIWLGADKGLFTFRPGELLKNPKSYRQVSNVPVRTLYEDSRNRLWIGTAGQGLGLKAENDSISYLTRNDGLLNNVVQFVVEDSHHHLCIGTEDGVVNYNLQTEEIHSLYFNDNKIRNFYNVDCAVMLDDGRMAFGTFDGIVIIGKESKSEWHHHGKTTMTDLLVNGVSVYEMGDLSHVEGNISEARFISLSHNQNNITIYFSNFDFGKSHMAGYIYKLEGHDQQWSRLSDLNFATYENLSPGHYTLLVRYRDEGGWYDEEQLAEIEIKPSPWVTWWAIAIYVLFAAGFGIVIYRQMRWRQQMHERLALEKQLTDYKLKFFTNISHEFRTPLSLIQAAMEKIKQTKEVPGSIKQPLGNMQQSTSRMLRLINQLLEFRRLQNNKLSLTLEETDIIQFVYNIFIGFHDVADNRRISYTFLPFAKSYMMYIDRGHVDKIIYNLLQNAFKYSPDGGGSIAVDIRMAGDRIVIRVSDTGIGVAKEKQNELFDRFSTGRVSGDSIGIGLNLSQELARTHHGELTYQENTPKGSIFTLTLPTSKDLYAETDFMKTDTGLRDNQLSGKSGFNDSYQELKTKPLNNRRVLIAEDNHELALMIQEELAVYFETDRTGNGVEALDILRAAAENENPYDLLVSDVLMPRMNGLELTRHIRNDKKLNSMPVILLTALSGEAQQQKGMVAGADAYIEKPFSPKILIAQAVNLIEQRDRLKSAYAAQPQQSPVKELIKNDADRKFIQQMDAYIEKHLSDYNLTVDTIAAHFEYGRTKFYNKVRTLTGKTPNDYLKEKRMTKAAELLRENSAITMAEVAYKVGLNNAQYFSVSFKKMFGVNPSEYQRGKEPS